MDTVHLSKNNITTNKKLQRTEHFRSFYIRQSFYSARVRVFSQLCSGQITFSNKFPEGASFKNVSVWKSREADIKCVTLNRNERNSAKKLLSEAVTRRCSVKKMFLKTLLISQENWERLRSATLLKKRLWQELPKNFLEKILEAQVVSNRKSCFINLLIELNWRVQTKMLYQIEYRR